MYYQIVLEFFVTFHSTIGHLELKLNPKLCLLTLKPAETNFT